MDGNEFAVAISSYVSYKILLYPCIRIKVINEELN